MRSLRETSVLILAVLLISCQPMALSPTPTNTPTPTPTPTPVARVQVIPLEGTPSQRQINEWSETVDNCAGQRALQNILSPTVIPTPVLIGEVISFDSTGWADIPFIGEVDMGARIVSEYDLNYGVALATPFPITIQQEAGTSSNHVFYLLAQVSTGSVFVSSLDSDREMRYDYELLTKLLSSLVQETPIPCPPTVAPTPTVIATLSTVGP